MPDLNLEPQLLCASGELQERQGSVLFEVLEYGRTAPAFAVRADQQAVAYLNRCAHVPTELDWQPGEFWDHEQKFIICSVHGALYEPAHGQCLMGPCTGKRLVPVPLKEEAGQVFWLPSDRFQPVF